MNWEVPIMLSKTSLFNKGIWRKQVTRFWPLWGGYFALWLLIVPTALMGYATQETDLRTGLSLGRYYMDRFLLQSLPAGAVITALFSVAIAMALYSYLYNNRSVNLFHALPVSRDNLFCTNFVTGLSFLIVPNAVLTLCFWGVELVAGNPGGWSALLSWFCVMSLFAVFFFGLATLCAMLTANLVMLPVLYGIVNFLVAILELLIRGVSSNFLYGFTSNGLSLTRWSPLCYIVPSLRCGTSEGRALVDDVWVLAEYPQFADWGYCLVLAAAGVLFAGLGLLLYRRYTSESAGDVISLRPLRPVFTYLSAAGCSLVLGTMFYAILFMGSGLSWLFGVSSYETVQSQLASVVFTGCMLTGGLLGYFAANMLLNKSFRIFTRRVWLGAGAFAAGLLLLVGCLQADVFGVEAYVPEKENISSIQLNGQTVSPAIYDQVLALHQRLVTEKDSTLEQLALLGTDAYPFVGPDDAVLNTTLDIYFTYQLENDRVVSRTYSLVANDSLAMDPTSLVGSYYALINTYEIRLMRSGLYLLENQRPSDCYLYLYEEGVEYDQITISGDTLTALLQALDTDLKAGTLGASHPTEDYSPKEAGFADVYMTPYHSDNEIAIHITPLQQNTWKLLLNLRKADTH